MKKWDVRKFHILSFLFIATLVGCSDAPKLNRVAIEGVVKHEGKEVQRGVVYFIPAKGHTVSAPSAGPVPIHEGRYQLPLKKGPVSGKYRIRVVISAADSNEEKPGRKLDDLYKEPDEPTIDQLEGKWEFSVTIPEIDEEADEQKPIQFDLKLDKKHRLKESD